MGHAHVFLDGIQEMIRVSHVTVFVEMELLLEMKNVTEDQDVVMNVNV